MQILSRFNPSQAVKIPRSFWYSVVFSILYLAGLGGLMIFNQRLTFLPPHSVDLLTTLSSFLGFALSWVGIKRSHWKRDRNAPGFSPPFQRFRIWVPFIFSMALVFQCLGMNLHDYYNAQHLFVFPSWADAAILGTYPLLLVGILCFPTQSLPGKTRLSVLLNSSLLIVSFMTFSWYFLLGPLLFQQTGETALTSITHLAFPVFDLLLISYIVFFLAAAPGGPLRLPASIFSFSLIVFVLTDSLFQYRLLHGILLPGYIALGWAAGNFLLALAVQSIRWLPALREIENTFQTTISPGKPAPVWQTLLPYTLVPGAFGLVLYIWSIGKTSPLATGTYSFSLALLALIFVKQIVAVDEIHRLNRRVRIANDRLEALATTDPLTELPNHRALMATLTSERERAERYQRACTLLFFDLDHFKALNDGYGHTAGDEALCAFGTRLRQSVRGIDSVGRWGGEEFLAILPETTIQEASEVAERIRTAVSQKPFAIGGGVHLTCSIGLASYPIHATALNDLVNAADQAMYAAKRLGRNQLRRIDDPAVQVILSSGGDDGGREETALHGIIDALISMVEQRNPNLGDHSEKVANLVQQVAVHLGVPTQETRMMYLAGKLSDLGNIGIPEAILRKPGPLTPEEWQQIKKHPEAGAEIITHIPILRPLAPAIRAHHECWDGTGYPNQLKGEEIPQAARIIAPVDAYMAMMVNRPHQQACSPADARSELQRCAGTQFDPTIVKALVALLEKEAHKEEIASFTA